jgi:hypothetical protein
LFFSRCFNIPQLLLGNTINPDRKTELAKEPLRNRRQLYS